GGASRRETKVRSGWPNCFDWPFASWRISRMALITRRIFLAHASAFLVAPLAAEAQQAGRTFRVGVIQTTETREAVAFWNVTKNRLRELGYVEGRNVVFL